MATITPIVRQVIGGTPENTFQQPRASLKASTGMTLPALENEDSEQELTEIGQQTIVEEDKSDKAVTLSPQLTALARKQQKLQQEIQAQRDKESAFEATKSDYVPKSQIKERMQANAREALQELGFSYDEITDLILNQETSADPHAQEIKKLRDEVESIKTSSEQNVSKQYEATLSQYRKQIETLVATNPEFDTIKSLGKTEAVLQHIVETFEEDGETLTVEQASKEIEDYLVEDALKMANLNKVKAKLAPTATSEKTLPPPKPGLKTLTQQVASAPTRTHNQSQHLSPRDRIAQAIARAQK